nr:hypothetical protein CFP56_22456 [Quercus suber]
MFGATVCTLGDRRGLGFASTTSTYDDTILAISWQPCSPSSRCLFYIYLIYALYDTSVVLGGHSACMCFKCAREDEVLVTMSCAIAADGAEHLGLSTFTGACSRIDSSAPDAGRFRRIDRR